MYTFIYFTLLVFKLWQKQFSQKSCNFARVAPSLRNRRLWGTFSKALLQSNKVTTTTIFNFFVPKIPCQLFFTAILLATYDAFLCAYINCFLSQGNWCSQFMGSCMVCVCVCECSQLHGFIFSIFRGSFIAGLLFSLAFGGHLLPCDG